MNRYTGDYTPGKTIRLVFNTNQADGTPITLAGSPVVSVYKDSSTTESVAGVTLAVDFDARTGLHQVTIDTSADGTFYSAGSDFRAVITAGTVNAISVVGVVVGGFSLANRSSLRPATADRPLVVSAAGLASIDQAQTGWVPRSLDAVADNALTTADLLVSAGSAGTGRVAQTGTALAVKTPAGTTVRTFTLDSSTSPSSRT